MWSYGLLRSLLHTCRRQLGAPDYSDIKFGSHPVRIPAVDFLCSSCDRTTKAIDAAYLILSRTTTIQASFLGNSLTDVALIRGLLCRRLEDSDFC